MLRFLTYNHILSLSGLNVPNVWRVLALLLSLDNVRPDGGFCIPNSLIAKPIKRFSVLVSFAVFKPSSSGSWICRVCKFNVPCNIVGIDPNALYNDNTTSPPTK